MAGHEKLPWYGTILSIQPRICLIRSFDKRNHNYQGYILKIDGKINDEDKIFLIAIGKKAQEKYQFQASDEISGESAPIEKTEHEIAQYYKTSKLKILLRESPESSISAKPPFIGAAPPITTYRKRGHRRLDRKVYDTQCTSCLWGCLMPAQILKDNWNPNKIEHRLETFCYGPKSCKFYQKGPACKITISKDQVWEEPDSVDEKETAHRKLHE